MSETVSAVVVRRMDGSEDRYPWDYEFDVNYQGSLIITAPGDSVLSAVYAHGDWSKVTRLPVIQ